MKFVELKNFDTQTPDFLNPHQITHILPGGDYMGRPITVIFFTQNAGRSQMRAEETFESVRKKLEDSL